MLNKPQISRTAQRVHATMRVLFGLFLFIYFYKLQSPLLELAQYQMSEGTTTFYPLASALILTGILVLLQRLVDKWFCFIEQLHFLTYVPSVILALLLTAFTPSLQLNVIVFGAVALILFFLGFFVSSKLGVYTYRDEPSFAHHFTIHACGMLVVFLSLGLFSNNHDLTVFEIKAAHHLKAMRYEQALHIGQKSLATSPRLTALRAYAMSHTETGLGDRFFTYPLSGTGAEQLLFAPEDTLTQLLPPDSLYAHLGAWRSLRESVPAYLSRVCRQNDSLQMAKDYWLTALLLEKDLGQFSKVLPVCYPQYDSVPLPRHYQEALVVLNHQQLGCLPFVGDSLCMQAYETYLSEGEQYDNMKVRENKLRRKYSDTYWWYYHYQH